MSRRPKPRLDCVASGDQRCSLGDIGRDGDVAPARQRLDERLGARCRLAIRPMRDRDLDAGLGEEPGRGCADAAGAANDERRLAGKRMPRRHAL